MPEYKRIDVELPLRFHYSGTGDSVLRNHNGQMCRILRQLTLDECDDECQPMFVVEFHDGQQGHVFGSELADPEEVQESPYNVYLDGIGAHNRGVPKDQNPYTPTRAPGNEKFYRAWQRGWEAAQQAQTPPPQPGEHVVLLRGFQQNFVIVPPGKVAEVKFVNPRKGEIHVGWHDEELGDQLWIVKYLEFRRATPEEVEAGFVPQD